MTDQRNAHTTIIPPEERLRIEAAERLSAMMVRSLSLLDDCSRHTAAGKSDAIGALNAAARLIKSNADITHALVRAAQGETRHRSIAENGVSRGLNPNFSGSPSGGNEGAKKKLIRELDRLAAFAEAQRTGKPLPYDEYADDNTDDDDDS